MNAQKILVVEDNPADVFLLREALRNAGLSGHSLEVISDGEQALQRLKRDAVTQSKPKLIVLDLNLPKASGFDIVKAVRNDRNMDGTLVVTWTSSAAPKDRDILLRLGVDAHFVKPMQFDEYLQIGTRLRGMLEETN